MKKGRRRRRATLVAVLVALLVPALETGGEIFGSEATPPGGQAPETCGRLRVDRRLIRCEDGTPFRWRGVTGFRLVHQVVTGEDAASRGYLAWARDTGFNVIRVLSTASVLFDLSPEDGRAALPRALSLAREYGLYVEVVAVNDSAERAYDWRGHARAVAEVCAAVAHCVFEFANEPGHGVQDVLLHDMAAADRFAAEATAGLDLLWTAGPSWGSDVAPTPAGAFVVRHLDRGGTPWDMARRMRGFESLSAELGKPVVSNEPIGFDEVDGSVTGRQRIVDCDAALAFGALSRVLEVGTTFHLQAGLHDADPGPIQRRCAADFIRGTRLVPDGVVLELRDVGGPDSPVAEFARDQATGLYAGVSSADGLAVAFGVRGELHPVWRAGIRVETLVDRWAIRVWRLTARSAESGGSLWESNPPLPPEAGGDRF